MNESTQKVVQYLNEAHATELGADPRAAVPDRDDPHRPYRSGLEKHLGETQE